MSRSFPTLVVTILVAGAMGAEAHQLTRSAAPVLPEQALRSAFAGTAPAQSSDLPDKVKAALKADPDLSGPSDAVTVTAEGSVVTLGGTAPTAPVRARIAEAATKVSGVTKVVNKIKLPKK
jgi:osmotically-inducible protein OsmY